MPPNTPSRGGVIRLIAKTRGQELAIKIRDTGIGIDPKLLPHLFDLFRQAESSLDRSEGGLGIGLTLVRSLVKMHGGRVEARSDGPGTGAEFIVRLPIHKKQASAPEIICTDPERISNPQYRILVVDDNVDAAEMLSTLLQLDGHEVWTAHDGKAALETAQSRRPDVILLDIGLPEINGHEVARRLRSHEAFRRTIVIAMTGFGQERDLPAIARGRLRRPFDQARRPTGPAGVPAGSQRPDAPARLESARSRSSACVFAKTQVSNTPDLNYFCTANPIFLVFLRRKKRVLTTEKSAGSPPPLDPCLIMQSGSVLRYRVREGGVAPGLSASCAATRHHCPDKCRARCLSTRREILPIQTIFNVALLDPERDLRRLLYIEAKTDQHARPRPSTGAC